MMRLSAWKLSSPQRATFSSLYEEWQISESSLHPSPVHTTGNLTQFHSWECDRMHHRERKTDRKRHEHKVVVGGGGGGGVVLSLLCGFYWKYRWLLHDNTVQVGLVSGDDCRCPITLQPQRGVHTSTCACSISCVPASAAGLLVSMLQSEQSLSLWSMRSSVLSWAGAVCWEGWEPVAILACLMQFSHCCLLKVSLAWKECDWSWPPLRNVTRKKFLAGRGRIGDVCYNGVWRKPIK